MNSWWATRSRHALAAIGFALAAHPALAADPAKVFRYAFLIAETSFDPQKVSDVYSDIVNSAMFDPPLKYDYLARPLKLEPNTLTAMPEISADGKTYTMHVKPGIYFNDDPAFGGKKRELTAQDYVYTMKRLFDPRLAAPLLADVEGLIAGSDEVLAKARKANKLDYDAPMEGLKALDRYTWQIKLTQPRYIFIYDLADCRVACAVAREVVERYGDDIGSHPVGTGPYRLAFWKRSSKMVFEPNPNFREEYFDAQPGPDDAEGQAILARQKGKRIPMVGRVEVSIIEESQPRWLAFQNEEMDLIFGVPNEFANLAMPNNKLAANLARRGIVMRQVPALDLTYAYFNMEDPVIGGYTPEKVALRRAISLAYKTQDEIAIIRKNQAIAASTPYSPGVAGYDPNFRTTANEYDVAKAKALLDMFGYVDRDGDGWRDMPDGKPLVFVYATGPSQLERLFTQMWKKDMDAIGVRMEVEIGKWPDLRKKSKLGKLQEWELAWSADYPDAENFYQLLYGPNCGSSNDGCFQLPEFDALYDKAAGMQPGDERNRVYEQMARLIAVYAPWKLHSHRKRNQLVQPWVLGWRKHPFLHEGYKYVDIDLERRAKELR
ncbi:MAG TPA: ABC transporter substrate-binding protein [Usitatibacter sp.]